MRLLEVWWTYVAYHRLASLKILDQMVRYLLVLVCWTDYFLNHEKIFRYTCIPRYGFWYIFIFLWGCFFGSPIHQALVNLLTLMFWSVQFLELKLWQYVWIYAKHGFQTFILGGGGYFGLAILDYLKCYLKYLTLMLTQYDSSGRMVFHNLLCFCWMFIMLLLCIFR